MLTAWISGRDDREGRGGRAYSSRGSMAERMEMESAGLFWIARCSAQRLLSPQPGWGLIVFPAQTPLISLFPLRICEPSLLCLLLLSGFPTALGRGSDQSLLSLFFSSHILRSVSHPLRSPPQEGEELSPPPPFPLIQ